MNNEKKRTVALIWGGRGRESSVSARGREHILPLIDSESYSITEIFIDGDGNWLIDGDGVFPFQKGFYSPTQNKKYEVDCAIPLLHGDFGEDGRVQGALDNADILYVGCGALAGAVCRDKALVKMIARQNGIPTLPSALLLRCEGIDYAVRQSEEQFSYPVIIKPTSLGSSIGVSRADNRRQLISGLNVAFAMTDRVIIEPYLSDKRELECGYFSVKGKELFTNPGEILHNGLYGYEEKYLDGESRVAIRADLSDGIRQSVREYSRRLVRILGVRDLARVDFFLSGDRLYFNEINTMPGFTDGSLYAKMLEAEGVVEGRIFPLLIENRISLG